MKFASSRSVASLLLVVLVVSGCATGGGADADGGPRPDGGSRADARTELDASAPDAGPETCEADVDCDDEDACNGVETCVEGACVAGAGVDCDDAVACTGDACDPTSGTCSHAPDDGLCAAGMICHPTNDCETPVACAGDAECDDGVFCNGTETCDPAVGCRAGAPPTCDDGVACTMDACAPDTDMCAHAPVDAMCDDGLACTGAERCEATGCVAGAPITCDDGLACTADSCVEPGGTCASMGADADGDGFVALGCGAGMDCNDLASMVHPGATELCDAVDNDCSGGADDGPSMQCALGSAPTACTTTCGTSGARPCTSSCTFGACVAASETCNDCDDDGDGAIDDGLACRRGTTTTCTTTCGTAGTQTCAMDCSGYGACRAAAEVCANGCDDDGDGMIDEGCAAPPPANDTCGGATVLTGTSGTRTATFDGATATVTDCASGREVWYRITLPTRTVLYLDTFGSTFDTRISVRAACGSASLQCEDDDCGVLQEQLVRDLPAGTYNIAVHAHSSATTTGTINLRWQSITAGSGAATRITGNGTFVGTTSGTGVTSGCGGSGPEDLHYFTLCPATTRTVGATTCSLATWDTVVYMRGAGDVSLACSDDACGAQSTISAAASGPGLYGIYVDGYFSTSAGAYSVSVTGL